MSERFAWRLFYPQPPFVHAVRDARNRMPLRVTLITSLRRCVFPFIQVYHNPESLQLWRTPSLYCRQIFTASFGRTLASSVEIQSFLGSLRGCASFKLAWPYLRTYALKPATMDDSRFRLDELRSLAPVDCEVTIYPSSEYVVRVSAS